MRYGFFHGIDGDPAALAAALELLADCDEIVCLGGLLGAAGAVDEALLQRLEGVVCIAGPAERRRARDGRLPAPVRERLRGLPEGTVVGGIAVLCQPAPARGRTEAQALGGAPRLVAPLAVAAAGSTRLWRAAGGLARVEEIAGAAQLQLAGERVRLDLGPARGADGAVRVAVIDRAAGRLEVRCGGAAAAPVPLGPQQQERRRPPARRRRVAGEERQLLLAV